MTRDRAEVSPHKGDQRSFEATQEYGETGAVRALNFYDLMAIGAPVNLLLTLWEEGPLNSFDGVWARFVIGRKSSITLW